MCQASPPPGSTSGVAYNRTRAASAPDTALHNDPVAGGLAVPRSAPVPATTPNANADSMRLLTGYAQSGGNPNPNAVVGDLHGGSGSGFDAPGYGTWDSRVGTGPAAPSPISRPDSIPVVPSAGGPPPGSTNPISRGDSTPVPTPSPVVPPPSVSTPSPVVPPETIYTPPIRPDLTLPPVTPPIQPDLRLPPVSGLRTLAAPTYGNTGVPAADGAVGNVTSALMRRYKPRLWT